MAAAYARNQGASVNRWPLYQSIRDDELISSWLLRNALAHGCTPLAFCGALWPAVRLWTMDIDCGVKQKLFRQLDNDEFPGLAAADERFHAALLCISSTDVRRANTRWLLSLGLRNRQHHCGLQYCPACFEEGQPYFRYHWRFAWQTGCTRHGICLISRCRNCHAPIQPQLLVPPATDCSICHVCGEALTSRSIATPCIPDALSLQSVADNVLSRSCASAQAREWFEYAYLLVSLLRYALRTRSGSTQRMLSSLNVDVKPQYQIRSGLPLELLEVNERMWIMSLLAPLVALPSELLAQAISDYHLPLSVFGRHMSASCSSAAAQALVSAAVVHSHKAACIKRTHPAVDRVTVEREWQRLQRKIFAYARP